MCALVIAAQRLARGLFLESLDALTDRWSDIDCGILVIQDSPYLRTPLTVLLLYGFTKQPRGQVTQRIHRDNLFLICPLWERANFGGRFSVGEVGSKFS